MSEVPMYGQRQAPPPPGPSAGRMLLIGALVGGLVGGAVGGTVARNASLPLPAGDFQGLPTAAPPSAVSGGTAARTGDPVIDVVAEVGPSVVTVVSKSGTRAIGSGTGFIVDAQRGYLITNNHVVTGETNNAAAAFDVVFADDKTIPGRLVGRDPDTDVAVLQIDPRAATLRAATIGDSEAILVGAQVVAIGSALGDFKNSVTSGVLSGKGRRFPATNSQIFLEDLLQTDAPISPGNSGGPLIWAQTKQVIGMNTLVVREPGSEGLGFAVSSNTFKQIADELIRSGAVVRGKLGVTYQALSPRQAIQLGLPSSASGVLVTQLQAGSSAAQAGIRTSDVIVKVNDRTIDQGHPLATVMLRFRPGDRVTVTIFRDGRQQTVEVTLGR